MREQLKLIILIIVTLVAALLIYQWILSNIMSISPRLGGQGSYNVFTTMHNTTAKVSATSGPQTIMARNRDLQWAAICATTTDIVWINGTSSTSSLALGKGFPISATTSNYSNCYFIGPDNLYQGEIKGFCANTTTVSVQYADSK